MRSRTQKIADMAIFIALGVVLNLCTFQSFGLYVGKISLVYLFCYLAGFILGPWQGFAVAFIADLIPAIFMPIGPYCIIISISNATMAMISGLYMRYTTWKFPLKMLATVLTSFVVCTLGLTAFGEVSSIFIIPVGDFAKASLYSLYPYSLAKIVIGNGWGVKLPYLQMMLAKLIQQPLWVVINTALASVIYLRIKPMLDKNGYNSKSTKSKVSDEMVKSAN